MSSPRNPSTPLSLQPHTFGHAPAAIYLVEILNQKQDKPLAKSVARIVNHAQTLLSEIARAHLDYDALSTQAFAQLLELMEHRHQASVEALRARDPFVANLVTNVLAGQVKTWKARASHARQTHRRLKTLRQDEWVPATPVVGEKTALDLQSRSKEALRRRGKKDTLY